MDKGDAAPTIWDIPGPVYMLQLTVVHDFGLFCGFLSVLIGRLYLIIDQLKISLIWHQVCIKTTSGQLSRGLSLLSRGLSCAVGLRNYAVFPSSFPCLWEAREGFRGGNTLFGHLFRLLGGNWHLETSNTIWFCIEMEEFHPLCLSCVCCCPLFMEGGKDMSLPIYTSLY